MKSSDAQENSLSDTSSYSARLYVTFEPENVDNMDPQNDGGSSSIQGPIHHSPQTSFSSSDFFLTPDHHKSDSKIKKGRVSLFVWNRDTINRDMIKRRRSIGDPSELRRIQQFNKFRHITEVGEFTEAADVSDKPRINRRHSTHLDFLTSSFLGYLSVTANRKNSSDHMTPAHGEELTPIDFPGRRKASTASLERLDIEQKAVKAAVIDDQFIGDDGSDSDTSIESQEDIPIRARISVRQPIEETSPAVSPNVNQPVSPTSNESE